MNVPDRIADVSRDALSIDIIEQKSEPDTFVFSEDRERLAKDGTDKAAAAHRQITHAVLKNSKAVFSASRTTDGMKVTSKSSKRFG